MKKPNRSQPGGSFLFRTLVFTTLLVLPGWETPALAQDDPSSEASRIENPGETRASEDCKPAEARAVPGAIVVIPGTDCSSNVDITDPSFSPFRPVERPGSPRVDPRRAAQ